jgi:hypothetical protein
MIGFCKSGPFALPPVCIEGTSVTFQPHATQLRSCIAPFRMLMSLTCIGKATLPRNHFKRKNF